MTTLNHPSPEQTQAPQPEDPASQTPLMRQYYELKAQVPDSLLFFRMGDFYELFGDDAVEAARLLEITLTSRDKGKANPLPMAGVPHHSAQSYLSRLLKAGKKVAIAEQMEDPSSVKGPKAIVKRDITRVFTPAVQFEHETSEAQFLATALPVTGLEGAWALALLDASTGECRVGISPSSDQLAQELGARPIRHFLRIGHELPEEARQNLPAGTLLEEIPSNALTLEPALKLLRNHYSVGSLDAFFPGLPEAALHATAHLIHYVARTQKLEKLEHLRVPAPLHEARTLQMGPNTPRHLDLIPQGGSDTNAGPNVFSLINFTKCALGARQLKRWLLDPLKQPHEIRERQEAVQTLAEQPGALEPLGKSLSEIYDIERIAGRVNAKLANPRDIRALGQSIAAVPELLHRTEKATQKSALLAELRSQLKSQTEKTQSLTQEILRTLKTDAPLVTREGGVFERGTDPELDRLITLTEEGQRWLIDLETREREATGISSLKVRYNRVFGYYIEITQAHLKSVPPHYQRKQTTVGAERFFTEELKRFEEDIVSAEAKRKALEQKLFEELLSRVHAQIQPFMTIAASVGALDALASLAQLSMEPGWTFPKIDDSLKMEIQAGRHPLVDAHSRGAFVPNDTTFNPDASRVLLITGPNMGGKSTVMRQVAIIVILGQMGAPVPAARAAWGAVSQLHTRIGAHDAIARGQSTFMVEMSELAHILHHADERSLIVLDEIGRGTSTYDGVSVAWSTLEWICRKIKARTLFATHYHELTRLDSELPALKNVHMATESSRAGGLRFLYQMKEGAAAESFGIHVAQLAGLPSEVISRAWEVLEQLEAEPAPGAATAQLSLFGSVATKPRPANEERIREVLIEKRVEIQSPVLSALRELDINQLTPMAALNWLAKQKEALN
jgi:DNA mismatch repair protein MutS